jgi:hypothetical protein
VSKVFERWPRWCTAFGVVASINRERMIALPELVLAGVRLRAVLSK